MQVSYFKNNTYFTHPLKDVAVGATRLASPSSTQRVGNSPEVVARTTARNLLALLRKTLYKRNASGPAKAIRPIITKRTLDKLRTLIYASSGILSDLEAEFIKFLLKLSPQEHREEYVYLLNGLRRLNAIILGNIEKGDDFTDPLVTELREFIKQKEVE
jgi:hypothetical protein